MRKNDYFLEQAVATVEEIDVDLAQISAGLQRAKAIGDDHQVRELMKSYANAKAERRNLEIEANEYVRVNYPPPPPAETYEQFKAKPAEQMTEADAMKICGVDAKTYYEGKRQVAGELASRKRQEPNSPYSKAHEGY